MNNIILKIQATSKNVAKIRESLELSIPLIVNPICDKPTNELYAEEARYKVKELYSTQIAIA